MLFWIFVLFTIATIMFSFRSWEWDCEAPFIISGLSATIGGVVVLFMIAFIIANHAGINGTIASMNEEYKSLVYQYENDVYDNDNDLGKRELITDIQNWNKSLAYNQAVQDDFWVGVFVPNIYDQFEFIELERCEN